MWTLSPESAGFSSKRLGRLNSRMQSYIDRGRLAGALTMLARRGEVFHLETHGVQDLESGVPVDQDTIFRLYSMTKPITSVAVMMLYEEGHFSLDDPVGKFIPAFANMQVFDGMGETGMRLAAQERPITIRHLLTHTSGLSYGLHRDTPIDAMYHEARIADADSTLKEVMDRLGNIPLVSASPEQSGGTACRPPSSDILWRSSPASHSTSFCMTGCSLRWAWTTHPSSRPRTSCTGWRPRMCRLAVAASRRTKAR